MITNPCLHVEVIRNFVVLMCQCGYWWVEAAKVLHQSTELFCPCNRQDVLGSFVNDDPYPMPIAWVHEHIVQRMLIGEAIDFWNHMLLKLSPKHHSGAGVWNS